MIERREQFILWNAQPDRIVPTKLGDARQSRLTISKIESGRAGKPFDVTTLASAVADKIEESEPTDFPAVVAWDQVATDKGNDAVILQFIREPAPEEVGEVNPTTAQAA